MQDNQSDPQEVPSPVQTDAPVTKEYTTRPPQLEKPTAATAGMLVLQWLTYAFWGWAALSLGVLVSITASSMLTNDYGEYGAASMLPYALAAVIVLAVIALITDIFYARKEPQHKSSASNVIMIFHAVLFALFAIGWVIAIVFGALNLFIGTDDNDSSGPSTVIITGVIMSFVYGLTLLRTLNPRRLRFITKIYWVFMILALVITAIVAIIGPAAKQRLALQDAPLEQAITEASSAINNYTSVNKKLPDTLNDITGEVYRKESIEVIKSGKIEYTKKGSASTYKSLLELNESEIDDKPTSLVAPSPIWKYQLCATFTSESAPTIQDTYSYKEDSLTSPNVTSHKKGRVCYDLQTRNDYGVNY